MDPLEFYIPPWTVDDGSGGDAEDIEYTPTSPLTADDVQEALDELASLSGGGGAPGVDLNTAVPQTLVLDDVFTYDELSNNGDDWYADPPSQENRLEADTNRALPRGSVGDVVGTMSDNGNDGIYVIVDLGSGASPWVLERHPDYDTVAEMFADMAFAVGTRRKVYLVFWDPAANPQSVDASDFAYAVYPVYAGSLAGHVEGYLTLAGGFGYDHAEGYDTRAIGGSSHSQGAHTSAIESVAHAEGYGSVARWWASHTQASREFANHGDAQATQHVTGIAAAFPASFRAAFRSLVIAAKTDGTKSKAFEVTGLIKTDGAGTHSIVTSAVTVIGDEGASGYTLTVGADADGLALTVGGGPDRTVATTWYTEVGLA